MMTDKQLSDLFVEATTPEHDPAFALEVTARIGRIRLRTRFLALAWRAAALLMLAVAMFVAVRLLEPVLMQLVAGLPQFIKVPVQLLERAPRFMGVPVPMVLGVLVSALLLRAHICIPLRRFVPPRSIFTWPSGGSK